LHWGFDVIELLCVWGCCAFCSNYFWVRVIQVLGVNPIEGFDKVKAAYEKKRKEAEKQGDEAAAAQVCYYFYLLKEKDFVGNCFVLISSYLYLLMSFKWGTCLMLGILSCGLAIYHFQLEKAYDKLMMAQLTNRKKGVTYGSFKVWFMMHFILFYFIRAFELMN